MAYITRRAGGWRAQVERLGVRDSKVFRTKAQAEQWAAQLEAEILARKRGELPRKTVADALTRYAEEVSPRKKGWNWERKRIAQFHREAFAGVLLADLTTADLAAWRDRRLQGVTGGAVRRDVSLLRAIFNVARKEWGWLRDDPFSGFTVPTENRPRDARITPREVRAMCRALGYVTGKVETKSQEVALAFLIALRTAMRAGEVLSLEPADVDLDARIAHLSDTKNGDARDVPLSRAALRLFRSWKGWTVTNGTRDALFRKARDAAGLAGFTFHDSRAEALTRLSAKLDPLELARMSGHRDLKTVLARYFRKSASDIARKL